MADKLKWGILGTGKIAHEFAHDLVSTDHSELSMVASRTAENADEFAGRFKGCKPAHSYSELIGADQLDVLYIATPNHTHAELAIECLRAGKHVLIEKPIAISASEAEAICHAAAAADRFCMEAMWSRFLPIIGDVKQRIAGGEIGTVKMVRAELGEPRFAPFEPGKQPEAPGAGAALDLGVYGFSLVQYLVGTPENMCAHMTPVGGSADEQLVASFEVPPGIVGHVSASHVSRLGNTLALYGTHGAIEIEAPFLRSMRARVSKFSVQPDAGHKLAESGLKRLIKKSGAWPLIRATARKALGKDGRTITQPYEGYGYRFQADEVARCIAQGRRESRVMPLDQSVAVLRILDQCRTQAKA